MSSSPEIHLIGTSRWALAANSLTVARIALAPEGSPSWMSEGSCTRW